MKKKYLKRASKRGWRPSFNVFLLSFEEERYQKRGFASLTQPVPLPLIKGKGDKGPPAIVPEGRRAGGWG